MRGLRLAGGLVFLASAAVALGVRRPWQPSGLPVAEPIQVVGDMSTEVLDTLRSGETVSELLARQGILDLDLGRLNPGVALDPRRLRSGLVFSFRRPTSDSLPNRITVRATPDQRVVFMRASDGWNTTVDSIHWRSEPFRIEGGIQNSLYEAIDDQVSDDQLDVGQRQRLAWDLADIYAWQVDFTRDIQNGDRFRVVFDRMISEDGEVRFGRVLASDLIMSGKSLTAFRFEGGAQADVLRRRRQVAPARLPACAGRSSAGSPRPSPAPGGIPCWALPGGTREPTTLRLRARPSWPPATASCCGPVGRAATET